MKNTPERKDQNYADLHDRCCLFVGLFVFLSLPLNSQHANLAGTLSGHGSWVLGVSFCPDNTHFVSRYVLQLLVFVFSENSVQGEVVLFVEFFDKEDKDPGSSPNFEWHVWGVKYNATGSKIVSVSDDKSAAVKSWELIMDKA
ncbi:WD repeat-containing protein 61 [Acropora cervicornis]|uniref:WD repeat-containing protein 61 n=1 Tax=Acropora cervicornis TaxID=6130 RepID=A0AAD9QDI8_ACRCE|nr:WD repeat-containing protein 61 [Acropora cervicornis]